MESEGQLPRLVDPADGRRVLLRLTPKSETALKSLSATHKSELARVGPVLKDILTHLSESVSESQPKNVRTSRLLQQRTPRSPLFR